MGCASCAAAGDRADAARCWGARGRWLDSYDEGAPSPDRTDAGAVFSGINGSLNLSHPTACEVLADAAVLAGADFRMRVRQVNVVRGKRPLVQWTANNGEEQQARAKVVIGADGRRSSVRSQAAIPFQSTHQHISSPACSLKELREWIKGSI